MAVTTKGKANGYAHEPPIDATSSRCSHEGLQDV